MEFHWRLLPKKKKYTLIALAVTLVVAIGGGVFFYRSREVRVQQVTLLCGQSFAIEEGGRVSFDSGESPAVTYDEESRTIAGTRRGSAVLTVSHLRYVEEYQFSVYPPAPEGAKEQQVTVDGQTTLATPPKDDYPVEWSSSDETVATVEDGVVTGNRAGSVKITETLNDYLTYTYTVTVPQPAVEQTNYTLYTGESAPLQVENYEQDVDWNAADKTVEVSEDGVLTAEEPGKTTVETEIGGETLAVTVNVSEDPEIEETIELQTDETAQLHVENAIDEVTFVSEDESIATVDESGEITPVAEGTTTITATVRNKEVSSEVTVNLTPEETFRKNNYGDYQPDTSIAALAMIGMCDYYNDVMRSSGAKWYDTNLTDFSPADTFSQAVNARRKGANCNSLLNWSWVDMGLKSGGAANLYGDKDCKIHGYNSGNTDLRWVVNAHCTVTKTNGATLKSLVSKGKVKPGDMLFGEVHTYIYRGEGTVFASAGDAKCHRQGKNLVFDSWVNGSSSYDWKRKTYYLIRFNDDYIPRYYRDKTGAVAENPMYTAEQSG